MIQITNEIFHEFNINYNISDKENVGIFFINNDYLKEFMLKVSGINKADKIYYRSKKVYDNKEFFNERLFLDCSKPILNTLISESIAKTLMANYKIILNMDLFNEDLKALQIRREGKLKNNYDFNEEGINLCNNLLALSLFKYPILLNPFENINSIKRLNYLKEEYKLKPSLFGITNLTKYDGLIDKLMVFSDEKVHILEKDEKILVLDKIVSLDILLDLEGFKDLIIYKNYEKDRLIIKNELNKDQNKVINELKVEKTLISIFNIGEYL